MPPRTILLYFLLLISAAICLILLQIEVEKSTIYGRKLTLNLTDDGNGDVLNQNQENRSTYCLPPLVKRLKKCLTKRLTASTKGKFWLNLTPAIEDCCKFLFKTLPIHKLRNKDDYKFVILPIVKGGTCVTLTIVAFSDGTERNAIDGALPNETEIFVSYGSVGGRTFRAVDDPYRSVLSKKSSIGNDIKAEKALKKLIPDSRFIGTDPIVESGQVYEEIGRYLDIAVGDSTGIIEASVLLNGTYQIKNVTAESFNDLLARLKEPIIDFLFLDAEGAEYQIMPLLTNERLDDDGSTNDCYQYRNCDELGDEEGTTKRPLPYNFGESVTYGPKKVVRPHEVLGAPLLELVEVAGYRDTTKKRTKVKKTEEQIKQKKKVWPRNDWRRNGWRQNGPAPNSEVKSPIIADYRRQKSLDFFTSELGFLQIASSFLRIADCHRLNPRDRQQLLIVSDCWRQKT
uniref:Methyltransferase FkbM domain-containing protein n=1 Tax=Romanomermis culicivorax TaxID=13658 RepID=A0A915KV81_ROMCU